jgi:hypothetical protein
MMRQLRWQLNACGGAQRNGAAVVAVTAQRDTIESLGL